MTKVMVFGTFDGIHQGHRSVFRQAKKYGDYLLVIAAQDLIIEKLKGRAPQFSLKERILFLKKEANIDEVMPGNKKIGEWTIVKKYKPDVVAFGYDQMAMKNDFKEKLRILPHKPKVVLLQPFNPKKYHTSLLK